MPNAKNTTSHRSVREPLRARPDRGRVDLDAIDPSETGGIKRPQADGRMFADEEHITLLRERLYAERKRSVLIEEMEAMESSHPKTSLDVRALKLRLQPAA